MELKGSQTQIMKRSNRTRQSKAHTNHRNPPLSSLRAKQSLLGVGDWLTDKDILCWLNQKLHHMEVDEPRV